MSYICPDCGGRVFFDITSQKIQCEYCQNLYEPQTFTTTKASTTEFETNVFTCSQCGGEIFALDSDITGFCSYCGSNMPFTARIESMSKPHKIIPFQKTKEECKNEYLSLVRKALFVPRYMVDDEVIEEFRGIYMPYWLYDVTQEGSFELRGTKSYTRGDYDYTEHYQLSGEVDMRYPNMRHDGSAAFPDDISERIEPYKMGNSVKKFNDSYLCGFYGERQDTDVLDYQRYIEGITLKKTMKKAASIWKGLRVSEPKEENFRVKTVFRESEIILLPVWFMSFKHRKRVSYATVNGQTGKVSAMIPIDVFKFLAATCISTVVLFFLFQVLPSIRPQMLTSLVAFLSMYGLIVCDGMLRDVIRSNVEFTEDHLSSLQGKKLDRMNAIMLDGGKTRPGESICTTILILYIISFVLMQIWDDFRSFINSPTVLLLITLCYLIAASISFSSCMTNYSLCFQHRIPAHPSFFGGLIAVIACFVLEMFKPVSDLYYFGTASVIGLLVLLMFLDLIHCHNLTASRPLPQFRHKGGNDHAE